MIIESTGPDFLEICAIVYVAHALAVLARHFGQHHMMEEIS